MEDLSSFLSQTPFTLGERDITVLQLLLAPVLLLIGFFLIRFTGKRLRSVLTHRKMEADFALLFIRIYQIVTFTLLALIILAILRVPLTAFAFVSGALAIGVGFGAQNILNNFISGWILMWERPIRIGDFLEIADVKGTVETINTRSTRIRRVDGVHMLIPNSHLLENMVVNWTLIDRLVRCIVRVGVSYGSPVREVERLIYKAAEEHEFVLEEPPPLVIFEEFGDNALNFDLYFWMEAGGEKDLRMIKSDLRFAIDDLFRQNEIVIAFPQRDVHLDGHLRISRDIDKGSSTL